MRVTEIICGFLFFLFPGARIGAQGPSSETMTLAEVVANHIQARGGLEPWRAVKTMKLTGTYTGFSIPGPFVLLRQRPDHYYFDHKLGQRPVTIGYDGEKAWWINHWYDVDWALQLSSMDRVILNQDIEFATPFFDYTARGFKVEYLGLADLDGEDLLHLRLTRPGDEIENWYLDPVTFLERARLSRGSDFGEEVEQTSYFSDFRSINGLMIPHLIEHEFRTRHRVMEVDKVEINGPVDESLFHLPPIVGMDQLQHLAGEFDVQVEQRNSSRSGFRVNHTTASLSAGLDGGLLTERFASEDDGIKTQTVRQWSYDRFNQSYLMTEINDFTYHTNLFRGQLQDGCLILDNLETDSAYKAFGQTFHQKYELFDVKPDGFVLVGYLSTNKGETWFDNLWLTYTRRKP